MQIHTLYIYFLPKHCTKLEYNRSSANYIFRRPLDGWPGRRRSRSRSPPRRARTPPRAPRRRSPSASSVRDSLHTITASPASIGVSAPPVSASSRRYSIEPADKRGPLQNDRKQPSTHPLRSLHDMPPINSMSTISTASGSSATQNLPETRVDTAISPTEHPVEAKRSALPAMSPLDQEVDPHKDERASLRAQIEQGEVQRQLQRKRIRELQQEISVERDARRRAEARLEEERAKLEAERCKLQDVRRECSTPFVTPALLDAFENISGIARDMLQP
ncbi:hypothetical protein PENSPDRAFT_330890 [Peniophora sp. CONT]|nr:hypothetical protein PENSPDRAFT_330890 [Peniophora sp. CONT]